jgi:hypothetical protein
VALPYGAIDNKIDKFDANTNNGHGFCEWPDNAI